MVNVVVGLIVLWSFSFFFSFVLSSFRVFVIVFQFSARKNTNFRTKELTVKVPKVHFIVKSFLWERGKMLL